MYKITDHAVYSTSIGGNTIPVNGNALYIDNTLPSMGIGITHGIGPIQLEKIIEMYDWYCEQKKKEEKLNKLAEKYSMIKDLKEKLEVIVTLVSNHED